MYHLFHDNDAEHMHSTKQFGFQYMHHAYIYLGTALLIWGEGVKKAVLGKIETPGAPTENNNAAP